MIILSDIILDFGDTSGEIFIDGLAHYQDIEADDISPSAIFLKTNAAAALYVKGAGQTAMTSLQTSVLSDIHTEIYIFPISCKLMKPDDKFIYELDPFPLHELDYYGIGTRLVSELDIHNEVFIMGAKEQDTQIQASSVNIETFPSLSYYDEYLLLHFDKYTLSEMNEKIIL